MHNSRFFGPFVFTAAVLALPLAAPACTDVDNPLCCTEFKAGGTINADIEGSAQSQVAVQAVADVGGIASAAIDDLTTACRGIAQDLGAGKAEQEAAEAKAERNDKMDAWCSLAVKAIGTARTSAGGTLTLDAKPPKCEASVSANANCQAKCSVEGKCDARLHPPKCTGGNLQVSCKGECKAKAGATLHCQGTCSAGCKGACTVQGGIKCEGTCEGTCEGAGGAGTSGLDANGKCTGTCKGTCSATAPGVECTGTCDGECGGSCTGSANASFQCDGDCAGEFEPLRCEGGKLEGGCEVDAKCGANCSASVQAKAQCTPPSVSIAFQGSVNAELTTKLAATLEANLPIVFSLEARLAAMKDLVIALEGNIDAVVDIKKACIPAVIVAAAQAVAAVQAAATASASLTKSVAQ
jgi:hypothetical protein